MLCADWVHEDVARLNVEEALIKYRKEILKIISMARSRKG